MEHLEALQLGAVDKYLLDEMPPALREEFEDHYFDCLECADDLRATTAFMEAARAELRAHPVQPTATGVLEPVKPATTKVLRMPWHRPAVLGWALAASLLVIGYQNVVQYPSLAGQLAEMHSPQILPSLPLVGANSRGGEAAGVTVKKMQSFTLSVDIPTQDKFASYSCTLYTPAGKLDWTMKVSSLNARDTVTIIAPGAERTSGTYSLVVNGYDVQDAKGTPSELARYPFQLTIQP